MGAGIGISWWMSALSSLPPLSASVGADPGPTTATEAFKFTFRDKKGKLKWRQVSGGSVSSKQYEFGSSL